MGTMHSLFFFFAKKYSIFAVKTENKTMIDSLKRYEQPKSHLK